METHQTYRGDIDRRMARDLLLVGTKNQRVDLYVPREESGEAENAGASWDERTGVYFTTIARRDLWRRWAKP